MACVGITARNPEQKQLIEAMFDKTKPIIFCVGAAGTGKSLCTLAAAIELVKNNRYDKVIYSRDLVQLGESIGFLPGDLEDKMNPFMICLEDSLDVIAKANAGHLGGMAKNNVWAKEYIETQAITFMRGRSINNAIVIIDEAQNLDMNTLKTLLTRIGENSKIILLGDKMQIDKRGQTKGDCDFVKAIEKLRDQEFVEYVKLVKSERSPICAVIDEILSE